MEKIKNVKIVIGNKEAQFGALPLIHNSWDNYLSNESMLDFWTL